MNMAQPRRFTTAINAPFRACKHALPVNGWALFQPPLSSLQARLPCRDQGLAIPVVANLSVPRNLPCRKQTLIILTSNLGAQALSQLPEGSDAADARRDVMDAVRAHFRPEFLNRLDETIIFDRLSRDDMDGIVDIQLDLLTKRLARRNITLELNDPAKAWLADEGYDPVFGARPLKRVIQRALQNQLAELLLAGDILDGDTLMISTGADGLIIGDRGGATHREAPDDAVMH